MIERRWETRLLAVVAMALSMIGIIAVYGASSLLRAKGGGVVGSSFAMNQVVGLLVGGVLATIVARLDYHLWERYAWPLLGVVAVLLIVPLLPFTRSIAPVLNGARRWVYLGPLGVQPGEFIGVFLDQVGQTIDAFAALAGGHFAPGAFVEGFSGGLYGLVHIGGFALGDMGDDVAGGGID